MMKASNYRSSLVTLGRAVALAGVLGVGSSWNATAFGQSQDEPESAALKATYEVSWFTVDGGGVTDSRGIDYELSGTIGQHDASEVMVDASGATELTGGFWFAATVSAPPIIERWESIGYHGRDFDADWALTIEPRNAAGTSVFSEPRLSGLSRIRVTFSGGAIDPASVAPSSVSVVGIDDEGFLMDLSAIAIGTVLTSGDTQLEVTFDPALPDYATYTVSLLGVQGASGIAVAGDTQRCMSALLGDVNGDLRVRSNDVGGVRSFVGIDPIDPALQPFHARADVNNDGRIRSNDVGGVRSAVGNDIRDILCP